MPNLKNNSGHRYREQTIDCQTGVGCGMEETE